MLGALRCSSQRGARVPCGGGGPEVSGVGQPIPEDNDWQVVRGTGVPCLGRGTLTQLQPAKGTSPRDTMAGSCAPRGQTFQRPGQNPVTILTQKGVPWFLFVPVGGHPRASANHSIRTVPNRRPLTGSAARHPATRQQILAKPPSHTVPPRVPPSRLLLCF